MSVVALVALGDEPAETDDREHTNTVKWSTVGEVDNFGFDVYRADSADGPFERITPEPIAGAGTTRETREYRFVDRAIDPYNAYWYYVESLALNGVRQRFTPVFRAKPKLERGEEGTAGDGSKPDDPEPDEGSSGSR